MRYDAEFSFNFFTPTKIVFGVDSVQEVALEAEAIGITRAILITDPILAGMNEVVGRVKEAAGDIIAGIFHDVPSDSGVDVVDKAFELADDLHVDGVISVGGGSVIDTAKGVALLLSHKGKLKDHVGFQNLTKPAAPHIAIPTTAGTGSEVTYVAVIKDHEEGVKLLFADYKLIPEVAILDPKLTVKLPAHLTAATGMDAISHAIEAMHSMQHEYISDGLALHALRLLKNAIPKSVNHPDNLLARGQQLIAATMAGAAFSNAQVGLVHAMAHTVGAKYGIHHGHLNAIFLPHVIRFNCEEAKSAYLEIAKALEIHNETNPCETLSKFLYNFAKDLGLQMHLSQLGVKEEDIETLAQATLEDASIVYNARIVMEAQELVPVYRAAM